MMSRRIKIERKTSETSIKLDMNLDGSGIYNINTDIPFFNHMLSLFTKLSNFDIELLAKGDIKIDVHHTVEDTGIILGQGLRKALGSKEGIVRYGMSNLPMDETLVSVAVDICSRAILVFNAPTEERYYMGEFDLAATEEFFRAFVTNSQITLHINILYGKNLHHIIEAIFKATGRALSHSCTIDPRIQGVLSTKGRL